MDTAISVIIGPNVEGIDNKCLERLTTRYSVYVLNSFQDADKLAVQDKDHLLIVDLDDFFEDEDDISARFDYKNSIEPILNQFPNINIVGYIDKSKSKIPFVLQNIGLLHEIIYKPFNIDEFIEKIENSRKVMQMNRQLVNVRAGIIRYKEQYTRFISSVSQKIRSPINSISGFVQLLQNSELTIKQKEYLNKIQDSANTILLMTNELSSTDDISLSKAVTENSDFNINNLLTTISNLAGPKAFEKNIELSFKIQLGTFSYFNGTVSLFEQILVNLTNILIAYSHDGKITFYLEQLPSTDEKNHLHVRIVSNCIDVPDSLLVRVYNVLSSDIESKDIGDYGSLYDLNIAKQLSTMLKDSINFSIIDDDTCVFDFDFTVGNFAETETKTYKIPDAIQGMKVLLVDSNVISRDVLTMMLENMSFRVSCIASGEEAVVDIVNASSENPYKLVIINHNPSDDFLVRIVKNIQNNFNIKIMPKIIVTSAYSHEQIYRDLDNLSIDGFVAKPIVADVMFETIRNLFQLDDEQTIKENSKNVNILEQKIDENIYSNQLGVLEGIDQNYGLQRVNGNVAIYRMILLKFYNTNQDTVHRIREAFVLENISDVKRILKNTQELVGNIGAMEVKECVESILKFVESDKLLYAITALEKLESSFNTLLTSIKTLDKRQNFREKIVTNEDHILINEIVNLEIMLREQNYSVDNLIESLSKKLEGTNQKSIFDVVAMYIKNGEPAKAIELLMAIKKSIQDLM